MKMGRRACVVFSVVMCVVMGVFAEMPDELKGSWVIDEAATTEFMKTSPEWKTDNAKFIPSILKRMSQVVYLFEGDTICVSMRGKTQTLPVTLKETRAEKYLFETQVRNETVTMTVSFVDADTINIRSSSSDDMLYYLWTRGTPTSDAVPSDSALAIDVMTQAIVTPPVPGAEK